MVERRPTSAPCNAKGKGRGEGRGGGGDGGGSKGKGEGGGKGGGRGSGRGSDPGSSKGGGRGGGRGSDPGGSRGGGRGERVTTAAVPLRLLCLHGGRQTGDIFRERLDGLCRRCRSGLADLSFLDGPHELLVPGDTAPTRGWMTDNPTRFALALALDATLTSTPALPRAACPRRSTIWSSTGGSLPASTASSASRRARLPPLRWLRAPAASPASA